jgi:hypothetical protein
MVRENEMGVSSATSADYNSENFAQTPASGASTDPASGASKNDENQTSGASGAGQGTTAQTSGSAAADAGASSTSTAPSRVNASQPTASMLQARTVAKDAAFQPPPPPPPAPVSQAGASSSAAEADRARSNGAAAEDVQTRVKRGACAGKLANEDIFRERRGGDVLRARAINCVKFDQYDYRKKCGYPDTGACDGIVHEAMRRVDRSADESGRNLFSQVERMRNDADADRDSPAHKDFCEHVGTYQNNARTLGLTQFTPVTADNLKARYPEAVDRRRALRENLAGMQPNDMAYLQLGMEADGTLQERGHAILVQRGANDHWTILDPNNGAFEYERRTDMQRSLEGYMDAAFSETEWRASPVRMQIFSRHAEGHGEPAAVLESRPASAGANPPETDYDYQLYADSALRRLPLTAASVFEGANSPQGVDRGEALAAHALRQVGNIGTASFRDALTPLDPRTPDQAGRTRAIAFMVGQHESPPMASAVNLGDYVRHPGESDIGSADQLVADLSTNFGRRYYGDSATSGSQNVMVVIDLARRTPPADGSLSGSARSDPLLIRRTFPGNDYRLDRYELYAPDHGVFEYADFEHMTSAVSRAFLSGRHTEGGIGHATTTWYADESTIAQAGHSALLNPHAALNLSFPVVPPADLPPPVATAISPPSGAFPHLEIKRETQHKRAEPDILFRPSTMTPDELQTAGAFSAMTTSLKDVNLVTHDFDVGSGKTQTDSAGYLATFRNPRIALDRLKQQSRNGFIYAIAPAANLVNVNATLGSHATRPDNGEFAAMGSLDSTQVMGWWQLQNGKTSDFTRNPAYRWDIYAHQQTAGAQPQLARFALDDRAWSEFAYMPYVVPIIRDGKTIGNTPKENPNLTQADFYSDAMQRLDQASREQNENREYRRPMTLRAYGGAADHPAILYADGSGNVYVNWTYRASTNYADNTKQFVMGADGRFHYPGAWNKTLRVGRDGYLYVGPVPAQSWSLNGVFRYQSGALVHLEDGKYLTTGHSVYVPFVDSRDEGARSRWALTDGRGTAVTPPLSHANTYWYAADIGSRAQLYGFDQRPESVLPPGTTHFITSVPGGGMEGEFMEWMNHPHRGLDSTMRWLDRNNAALLFKDGFYAFRAAQDMLEVRTLGGRRVYWIMRDPKTGTVAELPQSRIGSNYSVRDDVWKGIQAREEQRQKLHARLVQ